MYTSIFVYYKCISLITQNDDIILWCQFEEYSGPFLQKVEIDPNQLQVLQSIASLQSPISYVHSSEIDINRK